jgi:catechol 2,3-dioxygenase-like lactoylglutathione lyase family enzyme
LSDLKLDFKQAIDFYRNKLKLSTQGWTDIWQEQHSHAFVVAGANTDALVEDFFNAIQKAKWAADGGGYEGFRASFDDIVKKHGWAYNGSPGWRSRVIYDTNITQAYNAGHYQQMVALKEFRPYWRYRHTSIEHPRLTHKAWDGITLSADDPWWDTHMPQNGWGCKCRVDSLTRTEAKQLWDKQGKAGPDTAPPMEWEDKLVGKRGANPRVVRVPKGIDPGFAYNPGKAWFDPPKGLPGIDKFLAEKYPPQSGLEHFKGQRPDLFKHQPITVVELTGEEFGEGLSKKQLALAADRYLRTLQKGAGLTNRDTGWVMRVNKKSRDKMGYNPDLSAADSKAVAGIDQLVRYAVLAENQPDIEHHNPQVETVHRFYAAVLIDGVLYRVKLTGKTFTSDSGHGKVLHALSSIQIENALLGTVPAYETDKPSKPQAQPTTGRTLTITELLKNATLHDGTEFKP